MRGIGLIAVLLTCTWNTASAGIILSVDLDPDTAGVQSSLSFAPGAMVRANFILEVTAPTRITAYSFSVRFDSTELSFSSRSETSQNIPGWSELNPGSASMANGLLFNFDASSGSTLAGPQGPFVVGSATFVAIAPLGAAGDRDVEVGPFNPTAGFDGFLNDLIPPGFVPDGDITYTFASVNAIPEPSAAVLGLLGLVGCFLRRFVRPCTVAGLTRRAS